MALELALGDQIGTGSKHYHDPLAISISFPDIDGSFCIAITSGSIYYQSSDNIRRELFTYKDGKHIPTKHFLAQNSLPFTHEKFRESVIEWLTQDNSFYLLDNRFDLQGRLLHFAEDFKFKRGRK